MSVTSFVPRPAVRAAVICFWAAPVLLAYGLLLGEQWTLWLAVGCIGFFLGTVNAGAWLRIERDRTNESARPTG